MPEALSEVPLTPVYRCVTDINWMTNSRATSWDLTTTIAAVLYGLRLLEIVTHLLHEPPARHRLALELP